LNALFPSCPSCIRRYDSVMYNVRMVMQKCIICYFFVAKKYMYDGALNLGMR